MPLKWNGDDEHGYVGRVGNKELYRVQTRMCRDGYRAFEPCQCSVFYPPIEGKPSIVRTSDEAMKLCEADFAKQCTRT
jgi:hypothetical protein